MPSLVYNSIIQDWQDYGFGGSEFVFDASNWNGASVQIQKRSRLTANLWSGPTTVAMEDGDGVSSNSVTANASLSGSGLIADQIRAVVTGSPTALYVVVKPA